MFKYCCAVGVAVVAILYSGFHGWYWLAHKAGLVNTVEYFWVKEAVKPHVPSCPLYPEFEKRKNLICPASHAYYEPEFQSRLDAVSHSELTSGNQLKLLSNSESYHEKIGLIRGAKESVYIASLQLVCSSSIDPGFVVSAPHPSAENFVAHLISASQRGLDVRLFLDGGPTWRLREGNCIKRLIKNGVKVVHTRYREIDDLKGGGLGSYGTHEKLFVVDSNTAIVGGQNMAAWWFDSTGTDRNFRDIDLLVQGPVVYQVAQRFVDIWKRLNPSDEALNKYQSRLQELVRNDTLSNRRGKKNYSAWLLRKESGLCRFVAQDPHLKNYYVLDSYIELAKAAKNNLRMQVPAINTVGDEKLAELFFVLTELTNNDTRIDLFTNTRGYIYGRMLELTDGPFDPVKLFGFKPLYAQDKTRSLYRQIKNSKINTYAYRSWLHSKMFSFDDIVVSVGGFNYDESATSWSESTLVCMDQGLSERALSIFHEDELNSTPLSKPKD